MPCTVRNIDKVSACGNTKVWKGLKVLEVVVGTLLGAASRHDEEKCFHPGRVSSLETHIEAAAVVRLCLMPRASCLVR